jgi:hypothetical protein
MITEVRPEEIQDVRQKLRLYLDAIDTQILREVDSDGYWGFWIKFGKFPILIENQKGKRFCVVALQVTFPDDPTIQKINEFYDQNDAQFIFELTRSFTSPMTGFSRIIERGQVIGYTISRYMYPFHPDFAIRDLDASLQSVASAGYVGITFLKTVLQEPEFKSPIQEEPQFQPYRMFE